MEAGISYHDDDAQIVDGGEDEEESGVKLSDLQLWYPGFRLGQEANCCRAQFPADYEADSIEANIKLETYWEMI